MENDYSITVRELPLMIDTVVVPGLTGVIGISSCPGMKPFSTVDLYADRIEFDLDAIRTWGASVVVTLVELRELSLLGVKDLPDRALSMSLLWLHLPIRNMGLPDKVFEDSWQWLGPRLVNLLREGQKVLIHCKEGVGRSGIVAVRLLVESGLDPVTAIRLVRKARPGSLLLNSHEEYCLSLAPPLSVDDNKYPRCYAIS